MAKRKPRLIYSIICDDIREEAGNKLSFMGVYGPDGIYIPQTPFLFPLFCVAMSFKNIKGGDSFLIKFSSPSGKIIGKKINALVPEITKSITSTLISAKYSSLKIDEKGIFKIEVVFNEDKNTKQEIPIPITIRQ